MVRKLRRPILEALLGLRRQRAEPPSRIIVGLGNPGDQYAQTRHNVGFWCVDRIAEDYTIALSRRHRSTLIGEGVIEGHNIVIAKPRTFVNLSGQAIAYLLARYKVSPQELLVVHDDLALPPGKLRLRPGGSAGGHKGMGSIIEAVRTQDFPRLRIGIGQPPPGSDQVQYVLSPMSEDERNAAGEAIERAAQAVATLLTDGITEAMNRFN